MLRALYCVLLLGLLAACGGNPPAPIEDRYPKGSESVSTRYYTVQRGDTLYSIAFRYGVDFRKLAAANGIGSPYTIYPGQKLDLERQAPVAVAKPPAQASTTNKSSKTSVPPATKPAHSSGTVKTPPPVTKPSSPPVTKSSSSSVTKKTDTWTGGSVKAWRWPASGRVTRGYSSSVHKGIDIGGKRGDSVVAVADGKVVYAGTGIVGFGELLIVKHNEVYLSAYGHNDQLLVAEGQRVSAGQKIATKGSTGTDTVKLHFEIRREGKPIDPMRLLPRR